MLPGIIYTEEMQARAISDNRPLFTIEIDDRHLNNERTRLTIQGPLPKKHEAILRRTLLTIHGVPPGQIRTMLKEGFRSICFTLFQPLPR